MRMAKRQRSDPLPTDAARGGSQPLAAFRGGTAASILVAVGLAVLFVSLVWRAALPNNRHQPTLDHVVVNSYEGRYYLPSDIHTYEDVVTLATARHFALDGFLRTHLIPNRGNAPLVSLYDFTHTQCETLGPPAHVMTYWNLFGQSVSALSLNNDCVYTHYPPLADWFFGLCADLGLDRLFYFKIIAILANCCFLAVSFSWLRREVSDRAAAIAMLLCGTLPAFHQWADALYYHPFQYLLLMSGILAFSCYLKTRRIRWLAATWFAYFCEALASYQLTLFFGLAICGLAVLAPTTPTGTQTSRPAIGLRSFRSWGTILCVQATAPFAAFLLHFGLTCSLFGLERSYRNLSATFGARASERLAGGFGQLFDFANDRLLPWYAAVSAVCLLVFARARTGTPLARPLALVGVFVAGGTSFSIAMPGTTSWHGWMMYRHFLPLALLLLAYAADSFLLLVAACRASRGPKTPAVFVGAGLCLGLLAFVAFRNAYGIEHEIRWNLARNRRTDPHNLALRSAGTLYWTEGLPRFQGTPLAPISGMRVNEPPLWASDFRMLGPAPVHYEIWWLEPQRMDAVRLLVNDAQAGKVVEHCTTSYFDGAGFQPPVSSERPAVTAFVPDEGERTPREPYSWVHFPVPPPFRYRAVRFTCSGIEKLVVRQLEVVASDPPPAESDGVKAGATSVPAIAGRARG
jgi:hypothetical protein